MEDIAARPATRRVRSAPRSTPGKGALRIAVVAPPWFEVPPPGYGGIESMCDSLARGLIRSGHEVTLLSTGRVNPAVPTVRVWDEPPEGLGTAESGMVEAAYAAETSAILSGLDVDLVHDHTLSGPLTAGPDRPMVVTAHGPLAGLPGRYLRALGTRVAPVAISEAQRRSAPDVPWVATIHNGIDVESFPYREEKDPFVLFLGRVNPEKGLHLAIDAAKAARVPLVIGAKCDEEREREYFEQEIEPRLGPGVEFLGEIDAELKRELLSRARALLFPIRWEEPFGLVMAEALACGTPVVALEGGAVQEVVRDGVTGFVCTDPDELPDALGRVVDIDPRTCRLDAVRRFDASVMVSRYEELFWRSVEVAQLSSVEASIR